MSYQNLRTNADATAPIGKGRAVTPSDTATFTLGLTRGIWVGVGGNVSVTEADGTTTTTYIGVPSGYLLPVQCVRVRSTSTTATSMVAVY